MSGSDDEEISNVDRRGYREGGSDGDDDDDDDDDAAIGKKQRRRMGIGKAKQVVLRQFSKAKRQIRRIGSKRTLLPSSSSASSSGNASIRGSGKMTESVGTRTGIGCKFCFSRPKVLESPNGSPISDPNDPNFTHAMLRTLIENNYFYSKECNPHLD